jgi:hypothetical protein
MAACWPACWRASTPPTFISRTLPVRIGVADQGGSRRAVRRGTMNYISTQSFAGHITTTQSLRYTEAPHPVIDSTIFKQATEPFQGGVRSATAPRKTVMEALGSVNTVCPEASMEEPTGARSGLA